jgi:hypothetical protein
LRKTRECARYVFPSRVEFCPADDSLVIHCGETINIGKKGLCVYTDAALKKGQLIRFKREILPFSCEGAKVIWVEKHIKGFRVGLMFADITPGSKAGVKQAPLSPSKSS